MNVDPELQAIFDRVKNSPEAIEERRRDEAAAQAKQCRDAWRASIPKVDDIVEIDGCRYIVKKFTHILGDQSLFAELEMASLENDTRCVDRYRYGVDKLPKIIKP